MDSSFQRSQLRLFLFLEQWDMPWIYYYKWCSPNLNIFKVRYLLNIDSRDAGPRDDREYELSPGKREKGSICKYPSSQGTHFRRGQAFGFSPFLNIFKLMQAVA